MDRPEKELNLITFRASEFAADIIELVRYIDYLEAEIASLRDETLDPKYMGFHAEDLG